MNKIIYTSIITFFFWNSAYSQSGYSTNDSIINQDQMYNRPFVTNIQSKVSIGGYAEANTNYVSTDGVSDGFSMEMRRFNIFLFSDISPKIKFLSELEFEHGTQEIALETAQLDFQLHSSFNFRAGVLMPQIGLVNVNHDSPKWEFIERPISSTALIPTTLSEVGFGFFGKYYLGSNNIIAYNAYLVNGLQANIVGNTENKTFIPAGKTPNILAGDNNGSPMINASLSVKNRKIGELGIAYYGGIYNSYKLDGVQVSKKQQLNLIAIDAQTVILKKMELKGELVFATIGVENNVADLYGDKQWGGFLDAIYTLKSSKMLGFNDANLKAGVRLETVDFYAGHSQKFDTFKGVRTGLTFSPVSGTIFKANYGLHWQQDLIGNPAEVIGSYQFGVASYF